MPQDTLDPQVAQDTQDPVNKSSTSDTSNWINNIVPEDVRKDPIFSKYKEPADAFRALVEAQKFLGREKLPVPKDANDKETYSLIFKRLGLPETHDKYELPTDLQIDKDIPLDENMLGEFKKTAHELGVLPSQFKGLYKWYMNVVNGSYAKNKEVTESSRKEAETSLRAEWGAAYPQNVALAHKVIKGFADEKVLDELEKGLGNSPAMVKFLASIGKTLSEDQLQGKPSSSTLTPNEAQNEINKIKGDLKSPYWDKSHPLHDEAVSNMERLIKLSIIGR